MRFMENEDWFTVGGRGVGWIISTYEYKEGFIDSDAYKTNKTCALQKYSDISNIERLENITLTFCKLSRNYFVLSFGESDPLFCHAIKFWRDNSVKLMIFLVRFLLRNHRWNWCNFFGNFLHKGISTITPISCTAFGKFPSGRARVREHLSRKSWLVLNWPLSQHCAKNNRRRSVFVSFFFSFYIRSWGHFQNSLLNVFTKVCLRVPHVVAVVRYLGRRINKS